MPAMKTPQQVAQKWQRNIAGAAESIRQGVMAVTQAPTQKAAQALDRAATNYVEAITSGRTQRKLNAVTLQDWQKSVLDKGISRMTSGATAAMPKMEKFLTAWLPQMAAASQEVQSMPKNNLDEALQRVRRIAEIGKQFAGKPI